ncbi:MAG: Uma2 family endonuclease [Gemmataceae bacterium]
MASTALAGPTPVQFTDAEFDRMAALGILPANHSRQGVRFTRDQYRAMAENGFFDGRRIMLIHGEVLEMAAMKEPHACGVSTVANVLRATFGPGFYVREDKPLDVNGTDDPEPDVVVVPGSPRDYWHLPTAPSTTLAHVVVEVADATLFYDTTTKAELYATAGIADYWVLDVENERLLVFRDPRPIPAGGQSYRTCLRLVSGDTISLLAVPNTPIPVADFFP